MRREEADVYAKRDAKGGLHRKNHWHSKNLAASFIPQK